MIISRSKHEKLKMIADGEHLEELTHDESKMISIKAKVKLMELNIDNAIIKLKNEEEADADLFDSIILSAKTYTEKKELINQEKFLGFFIHDEVHLIRVQARAKIASLRQHRNYTARVDARYARRYK